MSEPADLGRLVPGAWPTRAQAEYFSSLVTRYVQLSLSGGRQPADVMLGALSLLEAWALAHGLDTVRHPDDRRRRAARQGESRPRALRRLLRALRKRGSR